MALFQHTVPWLRACWKQTGHFLKDIKITHSLFTLPFLWVAIELLPTTAQLSGQTIALLVLTLVSARMFGMGVNRFADRHIDARCPRTRSRMLASKQLKESWALGYIILAACGVILCSAALSSIAFGLSFILLIWLAVYSWLKRWSFSVHFYLGSCLGLVPVATALATQTALNLPLWLLAFNIMFWVAGFDMLYALSDRLFDIKEGLHSIPSRFGIRLTRHISGACFLISSACLIMLGYVLTMPAIYYVGTGLLTVMLLAQSISKAHNSTVITAINTWYGVLYLALFLTSKGGSSLG
ncbi:MAG: UbiA family prenyltransferase [Proteobacteria bacterium]|nr:UbiA family prenyltransferase [Pseudomonadota bacterium]